MPEGLFHNLAKKVVADGKFDDAEWSVVEVPTPTVEGARVDWHLLAKIPGEQHLVAVIPYKAYADYLLQKMKAS